MVDVPQQVDGLSEQISTLAAQVQALGEQTQAAAPASPLTLHGLDTTAITITDSVEDVLLYSAVQPAGGWQVGDALGVQIAGNTIGGAGSKTLTFRINGVQTYAFAMSQSSQNGWMLHLHLAMRSLTEAVLTVKLHYHSTRTAVSVKTIAIDLQVDNTLEVFGRLQNPDDTMTRELVHAHTVRHPSPST